MWPFKNKKRKNVEKEELPELPELPPLPDLESGKIQPRTKDELPALPSFPTSPTGEKISTEAVKHAIREPPESFPIPKTPKRTKEITKTFPVRTSVVREISPDIHAEPIFVRIDKYQQALSQFQGIKKRLAEIDNLLGNIREIRTREEAELQQWEQEIQDAKSKLNNIDKTIFQKLQE